MEQHPQDLGDQLRQVDFELRAQGHGYVLHQQDDGGLERGESLIQFYSVDFSLSRIIAKKKRFQQTHNQGFRYLFLMVS